MERDELILELIGLEEIKICVETNTPGEYKEIKKVDILEDGRIVLR